MRSVNFDQFIINTFSGGGTFVTVYNLLILERGGKYVPPRLPFTSDRDLGHLAGSFGKACDS